MKKSNIIATTYNRDNFKTQEVNCFDDLSFDYKTNVNWLQITSLDDQDLVHKVGKRFNLHPLVIEDILNANHMPKLEDYNDYLVLIIKSISLDKDNKLIVEQYSFILFDHLVISFQESPSEIFNLILLRLREGANIRKNGADDLLYALTDIVVDNYFLVVEEIGEHIDEIEDILLLNPRREILQEIYKIKRDLIYIKKTLWPMRNAFSSISKNNHDLIDEKTLYYFRDVYDHVIQMIGIVETYRDICSGMLDTYLSSISNKTNDIMKVLTIFSTIFIPLTFIAGVYGMNFKYLPELNWKYGYASFWIVSAIITGVLLRYFRKKDWL